MDLTSKQLKAEMIAISGAKIDMKRQAYFEMILHTEAHDYKIQRMISADIVRDFLHNYSDIITVVFEMPLGDYIYEVEPNKDNLAVTLTNYSIGMATTEVLKCILSHPDPKLGSVKAHNTSQHLLNREMTRVQVQLVDKTIVSMREQTSYGVFKKATVMGVMYFIAFMDLHTFPSLFGILPSGLKMVPPDNFLQYKQIIIPAGTASLAVPNYLQQNYGVYNGDLGIYKQAFGGDKYLFIYPLYRQNLFSFFDRKLYVISFADQSTTGLENTYAISGGLLKILVNTNLKHKDDESKHFDLGLFIQATEAASLIRRPIQVSPKRLKVDAGATQRTMGHRTLSDGGTGPVVDAGVTSNLYKTRSEILKNDGTILQVKWQNSNARLISPMMPVVFIEERAGQVTQRNGLVHHVHAMTDNNSKNETSVLTLFLESDHSAGFNILFSIF